MSGEFDVECGATLTERVLGGEAAAEVQALRVSICLKSRLIFEVSMFMDCCSHVIAGGGRRVWLKHCDIEGPSKIALACQRKLA
jgi:hypothetical protein